MIDIPLQRHLQRTGQRFEYSLYLVMLILPLSLNIEEIIIVQDTLPGFPAHTLPPR